jgi:hypothetical protein
VKKVVILGTTGVRALVLALAAKKFDLDEHLFKECPRCRKYVSGVAMLALQVHLADDHGLSVDAAVLEANKIHDQYIRRQR